jgi:hypothetical protein
VKVVGRSFGPSPFERGRVTDDGMRRDRMVGGGSGVLKKEMMSEVGHVGRIG